MATPKDSVKPSGCSSWWKHMRRYGKREFWKKHRKQLKQEMRCAQSKEAGDAYLR